MTPSRLAGAIKHAAGAYWRYTTPTHRTHHGIFVLVVASVLLAGHVLAFLVLLGMVLGMITMEVRDAKGKGNGND